MSENTNLRVAVIGGGPGGYAAAFLAADLGMTVTLIDPELNPGGVCLYRGCIPSKALLHVAKLLEESHQAKDWGIEFAEPKIDLGTTALVEGRRGQETDRWSRRPFEAAQSDLHSRPRRIREFHLGAGDEGRRVAGISDLRSYRDCNRISSGDRSRAKARYPAHDGLDGRFESRRHSR